jgi:hypothetical protein
MNALVSGLTNCLLTDALYVLPSAVRMVTVDSLAVRLGSIQRCLEAIISIFGRPTELRTVDTVSVAHTLTR